MSLVGEAGDVREVHHVALLIGYGAAAVNPYLAMETVEDLARRGYLAVDPAKAVANLIKGLGKGVLKVMSKMGISTISSYRGAQVFEAVGLSHDLVQAFFTGTTSRLSGLGLDVGAGEVAARPVAACPRGRPPRDAAASAGANPARESTREASTATRTPSSGAPAEAAASVTARPAGARGAPASSPCRAAPSTRTAAGRRGGPCARRAAA